MREEAALGWLGPKIRGKRWFAVTNDPFPHKEQALRYVGVDLHKKSITLCVVAIVADKRKVVCRKSDERLAAVVMNAARSAHQQGGLALALPGAAPGRLAADGLFAALPRCCIIV